MRKGEGKEGERRKGSTREGNPFLTGLKKGSGQKGTWPHSWGTEHVSQRPQAPERRKSRDRPISHEKSRPPRPIIRVQAG